MAISMRIPKNMFLASEGLISGDGRPENLGKISKNMEIHCYANWGVVNSNREYWPPLSGIKVLHYFGFPEC